MRPCPGTGARHCFEHQNEKLRLFICTLPLPLSIPYTASGLLRLLRNIRGAVLCQRCVILSMGQLSLSQGSRVEAVLFHSAHSILTAIQSRMENTATGRKFASELWPLHGVCEEALSVYSVHAGEQAPRFPCLSSSAAPSHSVLRFCALTSLSLIYPYALTKSGIELGANLTGLKNFPSWFIVFGEFFSGWESVYQEVLM